jgi:CheY-like chemotaxis protein
MTMILRVLLVEDDPENLQLLMDTLPSTVSGQQLQYDPCGSFEEAMERLDTQRYDLVLTDIYRDRKGAKSGDVTKEDAAAEELIRAMRQKRFCAFVFFSSSSLPETLKPGPFTRYADKSSPENKAIVAELEGLLATGLPQMSRRLHEELDRSTGSYIWDFVEEKWDRLKEYVAEKPKLLERIVRRRAAIQLGRLDSAATEHVEVAEIEGAEFYICPPISGEDYRLGEIVRNKKDEGYRVILTPHCHLTRQKKGELPRAEFVLTAKTENASAMIAKHGKGNKDLGRLRRHIQSPADLGKPTGRYWFLPGFLDMPDLYCDLLQLESVPLDTLENEFESVAVLDTPFAEALQSSFNAVYSVVGLPNLNTESFSHLFPADEAKKTGDSGVAEIPPKRMP